MSVHYKQPMLLIEFEEHKSFSLEVCLCVSVTIVKHSQQSIGGCRREIVCQGGQVCNEEEINLRSGLTQ